MNVLKKWFNKIDNKNITYFDVYQKILEEIKKNEEYKNNPEIIFEGIVFCLFGYPNVDNNPRGTYYGPLSIMKVDNDKFEENPGRSFITKEALNYWENRVYEEENPFLRLRYADAVFDLYKMGNVEFNYKLFEIVVNSFIDAFNRGYFKNIHGRDMAKRILDVAISSKNKDLVEKAKTVIILLENELCDDKLCGTWGFSFDYLFDNKNIELLEDEKNKIINDLLDRFNRIDTQFGLYNCVIRLTRYYEKLKDEKSLLNILLSYEKKTKSQVLDGGNGILINNYYQNLLKFYLQYERVGKSIVSEKNRILLEYQQTGKNIQDSLQTFTTKVTITEDEIKQYIQLILPPNKSIREHMMAIAQIPILHVDKLKNELKTLYEKYPLLYLSKKVFYDTQGLPISTIGGIDEDYDGNLQNYIKQSVQLQGVLLDIVLNKFVNIHSKENLIDSIFNCFLFDEIDKKIINKIVINYYENKYGEVNYLILPLIERTFRKLVQKSGGQIITIRKNRNGDNEISYLSLDTLLKNKVIENIFGKDSTQFFCMVLTDNLGFNLRNIMSHGLDDYGILLKKYTADILMSILFYLTFVEEKNE